MDNLVQFPKTDIIEKLEELLDQARHHHIKALAVVVVREDATYTDYAPCNIDKMREYHHSIVAGLADLQFRFQLDMYGIDTQDDEPLRA